MVNEKTPIFSWNTQTQEFFVLGHKFEGVNSVEDFINFINNLDEKNKNLEKRKNKAIEYLEKTKNADFLRMDLIKILKGEK